MHANSLPRSFAAAVMVLGILSLVGCSKGPEFAEVEGIVTKDGKPLERIAVEFHPKGEGPRSLGTTDAAGKFTLRADTGQAGAVVGSHKVVLRDLSIYPDRPLSDEELNKDYGRGKTIRIPLQHGDLAKTSLERSVTSGKKNTIDIDAK